MVKPTVQHHLCAATSKHSSSQIKDIKKVEPMQRQKSVDKGAFQKASSQSSKASHEHNKLIKVQGALRSCGRWSEHRSSSGKVYFYNTVSEVSQWEKPKEWDDGMAVDLKMKLKQSEQRSASTTLSRLSSSSSVVANSESDKDYRPKKQDYCDRDYRSKLSTGDHDYKDMDYRSSSTVSKASVGKNVACQSVDLDKDYRSQNPKSSDGCSLNNHSLKNCNAKENYVPATGKFYDYSSWNATGSSSNNESNAVNGRTAASASESLQKPTDEESDNFTSVDSKSTKLAATSDFVQKLSNVLTQAASTSNSIKSEENIKDVFQMLLDVASKSSAQIVSSESIGNGESLIEKSTGFDPPAKRVRSAVETSKSLLHADSTNDLHDELFKFLHQFQSVFDSTSIMHIQNWPSEQNEKQCVRLSEDFHRFIADQMSELSVQLTLARSQVRRSEILSTLHEQRVLYIRQQIKDLDKTSTSAGPFT